MFRDDGVLGVAEAFQSNPAHLFIAFPIAHLAGGGGGGEEISGNLVEIGAIRSGDGGGEGGVALGGLPHATGLAVPMTHGTVGIGRLQGGGSQLGGDGGEQFIGLLDFAIGEFHGGLGAGFPRLGVCPQPRFHITGGHRLDAETRLFAAGFGFAEIEPCGCGQAGGEGKEDDAAHGEGEAVAADQLSKQVGGSGRVGGDGLIVKVALDIGDESGGGVVAEAAIVPQAFHDHRIQISAHLAEEFAGRGGAGGGAGGEFGGW